MSENPQRHGTGRANRGWGAATGNPTVGAWKTDHNDVYHAEPTQNINIAGTRVLVYPKALRRELPLSVAAYETVTTSREEIKRILKGDDPRLLAVVGPCSIHDEQAAMEYAGKLAALRAELNDRLCIVMRVYFEKPRTTVGWKGLINDPHLDDSFDMETGLRLARRILLRVTEMGLPAGTEMLDPITPQYLADLVSWAAIGARTTESQTHRQMASGLSMPVGFKNGTDGAIQTALDALASARSEHSFLGIDENGLTAVVRTRGNPWGHLILRGGHRGPNYDPDMVTQVRHALDLLKLPQTLLVDCSHANANKQACNQGRVWRDVLKRRAAGEMGIIGMMLESNLREGKQKLGNDPRALTYGVSITDECIGWDETEALLREAAEN